MAFSVWERKAFPGYIHACDTLRIQEYIKETIIRITCRIKYKYIENYEGFRDQINFSETVTGRRLAGSIQEIINWLQNNITFITVLNALLAVNVWIVVSLIVTCVPAVILSFNQKDEISGKHVLYNSIADIPRNSVFIIILLLTAGEIYKNPALGLGTYILVYTLAGNFQQVTIFRGDNGRKSRWLGPHTGTMRES